jgi:hypothetical protein
VRIMEEEEDYILVIQAKVPKGNSIVSSHSFVCTFYN